MTNNDKAIALTTAEQARDLDGAKREDVEGYYGSWLELYGEEIARLATEYFLDIC